jgi:YD repeat-containing protein
VWLLALGLATSCNPIEYVYDELGRLVGVIEPGDGGQTAVYSYDAVGNVLAIDRFPTTRVGIIDVAPHCAPAGASVTVRGTAFDPMASANTVRLGGLVAAVTSAAATSLVVTVPAGAAGGDVTVTNTAGTATKPFAFAGACGGPPVVTSFTPDLGVVGMPVTVNGSNFDPVVFNDAVAFNGTASTVYSATSASILTVVPPNSTTGRVAVTNTYGSATSTQSFEVVATVGPYTDADVDIVLRMNLGETRTFPIGADRIALVRFPVAQSTSLTVTATGGVGTCVYDPSGTSLVDCYSSPLQLTAAGTYTLLVAPAVSGTPVTATITLSGTPAQAAARLYLHDATLPGLGKRMSPRLGSGTAPSWACADSSNWTFHGAAGPSLAWYSPPLAQDVTLAFGGCCPATFGAWGLESASQIDAAFAATLDFTGTSSSYRFDATDDVETIVGTSRCATNAAGTGAALHTWPATLSAGPVTLHAGDRLRLTVRAGRAPGTNGPSGGSGRNAQLHYNRSTLGADGATYVDLPKAIVFDCSNPADCGP